MSEPTRLRLVDEAGELAGTTCPDCLSKDAEKTRMYRSMSAEIQGLKARLKKLEDEAATPDVQQVFDVWADAVTEMGLWTVRPKLTEGRQAPIVKRLGQKYSVRYLETVMESVRFSRPGVKQAWVDIPALLSEPGQDGQRWGMEARFEECVQKLGEPPKRWGWDPLSACECLVHGRECAEFADLARRVERWQAGG